MTTGVRAMTIFSAFQGRNLCFRPLATQNGVKKAVSF
jgi:hypothetical protein